MNDLDLGGLRTRRGSPGRRARVQCRSASGRYLGPAPVRPGEQGFCLALDATLRAALLRRANRPPGPGTTLRILPEDLRKKIRMRLQQRLILFVVDASESMGEGATARMAAAKGAVLMLLQTTYLNRDRVGLVAFRGQAAETLLLPTTSILLARQKLARIPTGGATPFADGLSQAWQLASREQARNPALVPLLVVLSDGEANVPLAAGRNVLEELLELGRGIRAAGIASALIHTSAQRTHEKEMLLLARTLGAQYNCIGRARTADILAAVETARKK